MVNEKKEGFKTEKIKIAHQYAQKVKEKYDCRKIFLFGSYAAGREHEYSDIDIAVVLKDYNNIMDIQLELMRLTRKIDTRLEPHPFREKEFNQSDPVANEVLKYGHRIDA